MEDVEGLRRYRTTVSLVPQGLPAFCRAAFHFDVLMPSHVLKPSLFFYCAFKYFSDANHLNAAGFGEHPP